MKGGVSFLALNGRKALTTFSWYKQNIRFPAYQEPTNATFWEALNGAKDDILVYDRCGRLSSHVKMPRSNLNRFFHVWHAIIAANKNKVCGKCGPTTASPSTMTTTATIPTTTTTPTQATTTASKKKIANKSQG